MLFGFIVSQVKLKMETRYFRNNIKPYYLLLLIPAFIALIVVSTMYANPTKATRAEFVKNPKSSNAQNNAEENGIPKPQNPDNSDPLDKNDRNEDNIEKPKDENEKEQNEKEIKKEETENKNDNSDDSSQKSQKYESSLIFTDLGKGPYFKDGRTFEHLYAKSMKSPFYEKEFPTLPADTEKMEAVKEAFMHAWSNYETTCFGGDSFQPLSNRCSNFIQGGLTIIDSLSTIIVMGLEEPFKRAREYVEKQFAPSGSWSLFEFIIRILGGMISAAQLSRDKVFADAAIGLGNAILPIMEHTGGFFNSHFRISTQGHNLFTASGSGGGWSLAEVGTFQVEFFALAQMTGDPKFIHPAINVYKELWKKHKTGLISRSIGAGDDSYYEYVIKTYIMTGCVAKEFLRRHQMLISDIRRTLLFKTINQQLVGIGIAGSDKPYPMMEHLATFAGGMFAVGSVSENPFAEDDLKTGGDLAKTYGTVYAGFKSGLMPERVVYNTEKPDEKDFAVGHDSYILRPESVESIYYLYRYTGDPIYREYNWQIFKALNRSCRVPNGFAAISSGIDSEHPQHSDSMESFFLAETLKYLYLTFTESTLIAPTEWVFNTEAHPTLIWDDKTVNKFKDLINITGFDEISQDGKRRKPIDNAQTLESEFEEAKQKLQQMERISNPRSVIKKGITKDFLKQNDNRKAIRVPTAIKRNRKQKN
ncbi:Endoplasmic reticulum mannosyl-oligosaccharide 1,2-alpha-mannosidase [Tritrichomonas foetus]|uniref:alpha-1,2-Mannosidase n=1 Tax=Tritrichomonas foetus TaxID=1144522 RepID=A0A1J4J1C9_9EUKA|nr:Endoplasmic reticulum mannosyl-oligosaccharide 1,2-alpha-mannosidase [Tritrichomonas foetus]|eukprot:OHS93398.1 Endoplasmic reticulum mannosyl-oligosaccharide 1,2-alpha-mannosidase [Tritrichomonas foetus]